MILIPTFKCPGKDFTLNSPESELNLNHHVDEQVDYYLEDIKSSRRMQKSYVDSRSQ